MKKITIYIYTNWEEKKGKVAWLVEYIGKNNIPYTRPQSGPEVLAVEGAETNAIMAALINALKILITSCEITIMTPRDSILAPLENGWLEKWKDNDFNNAKGIKIKNAEQWEEIANLLEQHTYTLEQGTGAYEYILKRAL